jgi:hypothetical protein
MKNKIKTISENIIEVNGERFVKEDSRGWLDIPELGISVEIEVHDKNKSWNKLGLKEREKELLDYNQCIWLANSKYAKQLKMDGSSSSDDFFIQQPFNLNRKNGCVARFYAGSVCAGLYCGEVADNSGSSLGVRFAKKILKKSK